MAREKDTTWPWALAGGVGRLLDAAFWRGKIAAWRGQRFDRRLGVETCHVVPVEELRDVDPGAARHAVQYEPTAIPKFERAMRALSLDWRQFTFVDFGSGKGRVLLLAARFPFRRVVGIEFAPAMHDAALANIAACRGHPDFRAPVECLCADARLTEIPPGPLVAYFYNPFDAEVIAEVWGRVAESLELEPREAAVVYVNPLHREVFDRSPMLRCVHDEPALVVYRTV